jgi:hypothetical protein
VFGDLVAAVDGLTSRKAAVALQLSGLATDEAWWPTVARLVGSPGGVPASADVSLISPLR